MIQQSRISLGITQLNVRAPTVMTPSVMAPNVFAPNVVNSTVGAPNVESTNAGSSNVINPNVGSPTVMNPNVVTLPVVVSNVASSRNGAWRGHGLQLLLWAWKSGLQVGHALMATAGLALSVASYFSISVSGSLSLATISDWQLQSVAEANGALAMAGICKWRCNLRIFFSICARRKSLRK